MSNLRCSNTNSLSNVDKRAVVRHARFCCLPDFDLNGVQYSPEQLSVLLLESSWEKKMLLYIERPGRVCVLEKTGLKMLLFVRVWK